MKFIYLIPLFILFIYCTDKQTSSEKKETFFVEREIVVPEFQTIIDSAKVEGAILIYDIQDDTYYSNNFEWSKNGNLPASTFKIVNSIIALETEVIENDSTIFKWNGEERRLRNWEQDLMLRDAFHFSCVPCYQDVARDIGVDRMNNYLTKFNYGAMEVDSTNIDIFWLAGESQISQFQQIDFLKRFYRSELPISKRTESIMKRLILIEARTGYKLSGKTGWSIRNGNNNGWYVGYVELPKRTIFFATNIEPKEQFNMDMFPMIRTDITFKALEQMGIEL